MDLTFWATLLIIEVVIIAMVVRAGDLVAALTYLISEIERFVLSWRSLRAVMANGMAARVPQVERRSGVERRQLVIAGFVSERRSGRDRRRTALPA